LIEGREMEQGINLEFFFVCPKCKGKLRDEKDTVICEKCDVVYPRKGLSLDFRTIINDSEKNWDAEAFDRAYMVADSGFVDGIQHAESSGIPGIAEQYRQSVKEKRVKDFVRKQNPKYLLDAGCGSGWFSFEMMRENTETIFYGVDISPFRINVLKEEAKKQALDGKIDACIANGESLPFPACSFDIVVMDEVLEHLQNPQKTLEEINFVLRRNGCLIITTPTKHMTDFWKLAAIPFSIVKRIFKREPLMKEKMSLYDKPLSCKQLKKTIKETGFMVKEWDRVIFLPHESYLQFIPLWLLKCLISAAKITAKIPFLKFLGLHHFIILEPIAKRRIVKD
jgi:ubiquinone/menaquinone biosynthesis C-methylase UbiE